MRKPTAGEKATPSHAITQMIAGLKDWRGPAIAHLRKLIGEAAPDLVEDWKWGTAVWTRGGNVVAVGAFKDHVKVNFFNGAALKDPDRLFNAGLDAKASRAIDITRDGTVNERALKDLVRAAVALQLQKKPAK
ncbi:MAG TPA: DUF1801 domain-containing protein [Vineibacter sp.]|nr:DUF1801 domain-containing protein [Vineibacter sp.]